MNIQPPKWADRFLLWYCNPDLLEEIQGDAHELYFERVRKEGKTKADWKYIWDVIKFCRWSNIRQPEGAMTGSWRILWNLNLKISVRHALRNKLTFSIKVFGLSVCLAFVLIVSAFVIQEFTFDHHHTHHRQIFRIGSKVGIHGVVTNYAVSPLALGDGLKEEIPEVDRAFRFMYSGNPIFAIEDNVFNDVKTLIPCQDFLKVLTFTFIKGNADALNEPNKIVLTETTANNFYGREDPIGQMIGIGWTELEVTGVIKDMPVSSHLQFGALLSWDTFDFDDSWANINAYTYIELKEGTDIAEVSSKIRSVFLNHREEIEGGSGHRSGDEITIEPIIDNIADIHLSEFRDEDISTKRSRSNLNILVVVIVLFFVTGLINFHNLSLAELTTNIKKIGILKVFGGAIANHGKMILGNTLLSTLVVFPLAVLLSYMSLLLSESYFSIYIERSIFMSQQFLMVAGAFILFFIFSAKINDVVLSRTNDIINALKGKLVVQKIGFQTRELLVAMQLSFSQSQGGNRRRQWAQIG